MSKTEYKVAWGLIIAGAIYETLVAISSADANVSGKTMDQTAFGKLYGPIETINPLPIDAGTTALVAGGLLLVSCYL